MSQLYPLLLDTSVSWDSYWFASIYFFLICCIDKVVRPLARIWRLTSGLKPSSGCPDPDLSNFSSFLPANGDIVSLIKTIVASFHIFSIHYLLIIVFSTLKSCYLSCFNNPEMKNRILRSQFSWDFTPCRLVCNYLWCWSFRFSGILGRVDY